MSFRILIFIAAVTTWMECSGQNVDVPDDTVYAHQIITQKPDNSKGNFHGVLMSLCKSIPFNSSAKYQYNLSLHVRAIKNVFVGMRYEYISHIWEHKLEADTVTGFTAELSVLAYSNPIHREKKVDVGLWSSAGAGIFSAKRYLGLPGGFNYYEEFKERPQYYVRLSGGVYFKYYGVILTLGCFLSDLKVGRHEENGITGILRKPCSSGLELGLRFMMW